jgi:hypothetical protein
MNRKSMKGDFSKEPIFRAFVGTFEINFLLEDEF